MQVIERRSWTLAVASGVAVVLGVGVAAYARFVGPLPAETWLAHHLYALNVHRTVGDTAAFFTGMGSPPVVLGLVAAAVWFGRHIPEPTWTARVVGTAAAPAIALVLKTLVGTTQASVEARGIPLASTSATLPSAHAAFAASFFGLLALAAVRRSQRDAAGLAVLVALAIGISVMVRGAHLLSDVLAGYALGFAWLGSVVLATGRFDSPQSDATFPA